MSKSFKFTNQYWEETGKDAFTGSIAMGTWEYNDGYVEWLEHKLNNDRKVIKLLTQTLGLTTTTLEGALDTIKELKP